MSYAKLYEQTKAELDNLKLSTSAMWLNRYVRFITETGKRDEFILWVAKDLGLDQETICRLFPVEAHTPNAETVAALEESDAGGGEVFQGTTEEAFDKITSEDDAGTDGQTVRE